MEYKEKLAKFAALVEANQKQAHERKYRHPFNNPISIKPGAKYDKVDVGGSGKFMVEARTGNIFGIKGYGQVHKGHFYGTLDTIADYFWGEYYPVKLDGSLARQKANNVPVITHAPQGVV